MHSALNVNENRKTTTIEEKTVETRTRLHNLTLDASLYVFMEMLTNQKKKTTEEFR